MADAPLPPIDERLAAELDGARHQIEELALLLCLDPIVFDRHAGPLQRFDHVAQILGEIAGVLRHRGTRQDALAIIRLESMRMRMTGAAPADEDDGIVATQAGT